MSYLANKIFLLKLENKNKQTKNPELSQRTLINYFSIGLEKSIIHGDLVSFPTTIEKEIMF